MKVRSPFIAVLATLCVSCASGCDKDWSTEPVQWVSVGSIGATLTFIEANRQARYQVSADKLRSRSGVRDPIFESLEGAPISTAQRQDSERSLLVLVDASSYDDCREDDRNPPLPPRLWVINERAAEAIPLARASTSIAQSEQGRYAVLYSRDSTRRAEIASGGTSDIEWVDLEKKKARCVSISSRGTDASFIALAPDSFAQHFTAVGFDNHLVLLAIDEDAGSNADGCEIAATHANGLTEYIYGADRSDFSPDEVAFASGPTDPQSKDPATEYVVVRDESQSEILSFSRLTSAKTTKPDETLVVESVSLGGAPIAMVTHGDAVLALVATDQGKTSLVDVKLGAKSQITIPLDFAATALLKYSGDKKAGALVYALDGRDGFAQVTFDELKQGQSGRVSPIPVDAEIARVELIPGCAQRPRVLVGYAGGGLGVLDLEDSALSSALPGIDTSMAIVTPSSDEQDPCTANIWVPVPNERTLFRVQLGLEDGAQTLRIRKLRLAVEGRAVVPLDGGAAIVHAGTMGRVTFIDEGLDSEPVLHEGFLADSLGECR